MSDNAPDLQTLRRALVVKLRHHGDVLLSSPVFQVLKNHAPQLEIDALVYADTAPMLALHPAISQLHSIDRNWKRQGLRAQFAAERALLARLRARRYDLIVHLTEHPRGAWLARLSGARWAVAPKKPGAGRWWARSFSHLYPLIGRRHTVELNLDALRRLGLQPGADERRLVLLPGAAAETRVDGLLAAAGLQRGGFVHLHPASRWHFKCWTVEANAALVERLGEAGWPVVLTAAPEAAERRMVAAIVGAARSTALDLSGQLSLKELAALTARARLFVGVDSAPMHIAAAMGTPTVALFGPSGERDWGPWQVAHRVVASGAHRCRPCGQDGCGGGKVSECLTTLPLAAVADAVFEMLGARGPGLPPMGQ